MKLNDSQFVSAISARYQQISELSNRALVGHNKVNLRNLSQITLSYFKRLPHGPLNHKLYYRFQFYSTLLNTLC